MDIEHILKKSGKKAEQQGDKIFALDIGTRTVVGIVGERDGDKFRILEYVVVPHTRRAMVDGQIEDIKQAAKIVGQVKQQLEEKTGFTLERACIAAAGRALRTINVSKEFDISSSEIITEEMVSSMEMETISAAQDELDRATEKDGTLFYCVGHNVVSYHLDNYRMISVTGHKGQRVRIDMVVAFLPGIVVEGLYSVMEINHLEVQSLTLEPIAAMNVIIPPEIRLINIALVDIGAGTSDIAVSKDGSIIAYAMATVAGDEITEEIIKTFLVDFAAAEQMKYDAADKEEFTYQDIFGNEHTVTQEDFIESVLPSLDNLAATICSTIIKINSGSPQAVFLVGGGSLIKGLTTLVADKLDIDEDRVAVGGSEFARGVELGGFKMGAEFITPIGIGVTALDDKGYDFSVITVNGKKVRVFDTKKLTVFQLLSMSGFKAAEIMGHSGQGLAFTINGKKIFRKGAMMTPAEVTVNGKAAALTTVVTQGDSVTFVPAKNGDNARSTLQKEIDYGRYNSGFVSFGGKKYKFGLEVAVNGTIRTPDYEIQPLDEIVTGGILTLGDLLEFLGVEYAEGFAVNGKLADQGEVLHDGDRVALKIVPTIDEAYLEAGAVVNSVNAADTISAAPAVPNVQVQPAAPVQPVYQQPQISPVIQAEESAPAQRVSAQNIGGQGFGSSSGAGSLNADLQALNMQIENARSGVGSPSGLRETSAVQNDTAAYAVPQKDAEEENRSLAFKIANRVPELTLTLNGEPLTLPEKTDGEPHTFIELMSYVDIDTKKPKGSNIELTLNGVEISFGEELHDGDKAVVRWMN